MTGMKQRQPSLLRSLGIGLGILVVLVIYAYGFQVTKVNLEETKSERRQQQLVRILRALAQPNLLEYDKEEFRVSLPFYSPCPVEGYTPPAPDETLPYLVATPACADPRAEVHLEGFNFEPLTTGPINFVPADSDVNLQLGSIEIDEEGHFEAVVRIPNRPSDHPHRIEAITRRNIGAPRLTQTAIDTWNKIVETVFLALLATTIGTLFSVPLSFFAARNLMKDITSTLSNAALAILFIPIGIYLGGQFSNWASQLSAILTQNMLISIGSLALIPVLGIFGFQWAFPPEELRPASMPLRLARGGITLVLVLLGIIFLYQVSFLAMSLGNQASLALGSWGFLGRFVRDLGDILGMITPALVALGGAGVFSSLAGRLSKFIGRVPVANRIAHFVLAPAAGAALFWMLAAAINWFYQFINAKAFLMDMSLAGAISGLALAIFTKPNTPLPVGLVIYYISRTIFNALRSIEALVMAIVFVVWVGIGPFAGSLALALHTIAALAKLYSEQVESIMPGPIEAIQATGANRLQTIVYAVLPQIIPPYISFTMYRWDINVRMSTIIGFAGGGGIGFLLQQNINLLNYRDASAQMLAIAIVVAAMDYLSSKLREKFV